MTIRLDTVAPEDSVDQQAAPTTITIIVPIAGDVTDLGTGTLTINQAKAVTVIFSLELVTMPLPNKIYLPFAVRS